MNSPQSITIKTNTVRVLINDDPNKVIEFDPADVYFIEEYYKLLNDFENQMKTFKARRVAIERDKSVDKHGVPRNTAKQIELVKDICKYMRNRIDRLFGKGTSQTAFGNSNNISVFYQFLDGITPFIQTARDKMIEKYIPEDKETTDLVVME